MWSGACQFDNRVAFDFKVADFDAEETKCLSMSIQEYPSTDGNIGAGVVEIISARRGGVCFVNMCIIVLYIHTYNCGSIR